jgi:hypothetical protein
MALQIKRARKVVDFYPDQAVALEVEAAQKALDEAEAAKKTMNSKAVTEASKRLDEARASASASVLEIELEARPRKRWAEIEEAHPPRKDDKVDDAFTIGWDTFLPEVLPESVVAVRNRETGAPVEVAPEEWAGVLDEISDGQYQTLAMAVLQLNRSSANPF